MTTVLDCIERIPGCLEEMKDSYPKRVKALTAYLQEKGMTQIDRLVFIASGSSYNSAHTAKLFIKNHCGIETELKYPNIFVNYEAETELSSKRRGRENTLYVVISQGGETKLAYQALEKLKAAGMACMAITKDADTSIARLAELHLDMGCNEEEFMYRTIGFSTSAAACWLLGLAAGVYNGQADALQEKAFLADFDAMINNLPDVRKVADQWYQAHRFSLLRRNKMMLAGTGDLYPIVNEGDIKIMEMVPMMTRSFELEEFIHGPQNAFDGATLFLILHHKGEDDEKAKSISRFLKEQIGFCALIGEAPVEERDLAFTPASRYFFALEYVTVLQLLAYRMADDRGRDLHRGVNAVVSRYITKIL